MQVVYAARGDRASDSLFKRMTAGVYYRLVERISGVPVTPHAGDHRLLHADVVKALRALPERRRVYRLLIPLLGFDSAVVHHRREVRAAGKTSYSLRRMVLLANDSIVSFTSTPLRLATGLGLLTALLSGLLGVWVLLVKATGNAVPGWASVTLGVLFLGAVQVVLGGAGRIRRRIYDEVKARPLYRVRGTSSPPAQRGAATPTRVPEVKASTISADKGANTRSHRRVQPAKNLALISGRAAGTPGTTPSGPPTRRSRSTSTAARR